MVMCSIQDTVAEYFMPPQCFQSEAQARRSFGDAVNSGEGDFSRHPEDFVLVLLGEFCPDDGSVEVASHIQVLCTGASLRTPKSEVK